MKKTFTLTDTKIDTMRLVEAAKKDVRKYLKRERRKKLPEDMDFWDFDCKWGKSVEEAESIHSAEITKYIDKSAELELDSFYLEILAKAAKRTKKPTEEATEDLELKKEEE